MLILKEVQCKAGEDDDSSSKFRNLVVCDSFFFGQGQDFWSSVILDEGTTCTESSIKNSTTVKFERSISTREKTREQPQCGGRRMLLKMAAGARGGRCVMSAETSMYTNASFPMLLFVQFERSGMRRNDGKWYVSVMHREPVLIRSSINGIGVVHACDLEIKYQLCLYIQCTDWLSEVVYQGFRYISGRNLYIYRYKTVTCATWELPLLLYASYLLHLRH